MKRLFMVMGMICFLVGFLALVGGALAAMVSLYAFSVADMRLLPHRPFSELVLAVVPGVVVALVGIALLFCSSLLDKRGAVRRYGKRKSI